MLSKGLSKAQTLEYVSTKVSLFRVPELSYFKITDYKKAPVDTIKKIQAKFNGRTVVVRSSASDEDGSLRAAAGEYDSVLSIDSNDYESLSQAIETVINSIEHKRKCTPYDECLVQEMVENSNMSGVIFTHDLNTGAPYYVVNYDDSSGLTNTVTAGDNEYSNRTLYVYRGASSSLRSSRFSNLLNATIELENILNSKYLDIEFAIDKNLKPCLLQVRSITTHKKWNKSVSKEIDKTLIDVQAFVKERFKPKLEVFGDTTILGQMPDWNPVEMIGRAPRALAYSLYETLITNDAWRIAREKMGYSVPKGQPLMVSLAGQPYIDTRLSFHSYLPKSLSPEISKKLVNAWIDHLKNEPTLHDKVEFEVAITTYSFDIDERIDRLVGSKLTDIEKEDFKNALHEQTHSLLLDDGEHSLKDALDKIEKLNIKQSKYKESTFENNLDIIFKMVTDCIQYGTIPFSILARHGFIARTILLSLAQRKIISIEEADLIQSSVKTVASEFVEDSQDLKEGNLSQSKFFTKYGHLRPGTYDILSPRYDQMEDLVNIGQTNKVQTLSKFELSSHQNEQINNLLIEEGFQDLDAGGLLEYVRAATVGREYGKFIFSRSVSDILEYVSVFGENHGLSRDQMSHIAFNNLLHISQSQASDDFKTEDYLKKISKSNANKHYLTNAIRLPQLLFDEAGVFVVPFQVSAPNFITHKNITAPVLLLTSRMDIDISLLRDKIILIESADPGFDWIFAQNIVGLITKYGGANSHMAIRCAEFGIPAAIGCGEQRFESIQNSKKVLLDCSSGFINILD